MPLPPFNEWTCDHELAGAKPSGSQESHTPRVQPQRPLKLQFSGSKVTWVTKGFSKEADCSPHWSPLQ